MAFNAEVKRERDLLYPVVYWTVEWRKEQERYENTAYKHDQGKIRDAAMVKLNEAIQNALNDPVVSEKLKRGCQ